MYNNIGKKIKGLAIAAFIAFAIASFFVGVFFCTEGGTGILIGLLIMIFGPFVGYVSSWLLYGFGELVDNSTNQANNYPTSATIVTNQVKKASVDNDKTEAKVTNKSANTIKSSNGQSTFYNDGSKYSGEYSGSERHGQGKCVFPDGSVYEGTWVHDKFSGYGKYTLANKDSYKGEFKDGKIHGSGCYTFAPSGSTFNGLFRDGKPFQGNGFVRFNDGYYKGEIDDFLPHGKGSYYYKNGNTYIGTFKCGIYFTGTLYDKSNHILENYKEANKI